MNPPITADVEPASCRSRKWGMSLDAWNNLLLAFLAVAAIAAAIVGIATYASVHLTKEESARAKKELEEYKLTVEGKVSDAKTAGIEAGKTAGDALVKSATLQKEAEEAKLETEKIKQTVTWRTLTPEVAEKLKASLATKPGAVNLRYTDGDPEALFLAIQLGNILSAAKWKVAHGAEKTNGLLFGISLPNGAGVVPLREAFSAAGIAFGTGAPPSGGMIVGFMVSTIPGAPTLFVGSREPPTFK